MKKILKTILFYPLNLLNFIAIVYTSFAKIIYPNLESKWHQFILERNKKLTFRINHTNSKKNKITINISTPNITTTTRAKTFSTKEPDTLKWVDSFKPNSVFLDVGANIGVYSLYAAANQNKINVIPNPLFSDNKVSTFTQSKPDAGEAHSSFAVDYGDDGKKLAKNSYYSTLGLNIDFLVINKLIEFPNYIKIDVDGIEELILLGAQRTLANNKCYEVLIESNKAMKKQSIQIKKIMTKLGYRLKEISDIGDKRNQNIINQIWAKDI